MPVTPDALESSQPVAHLLAVLDHAQTGDASWPVVHELIWPTKSREQLYFGNL